MEELQRHTAALLILYDEFLRSLTDEEKEQGMHHMLGIFIIYLQNKEGINNSKSTLTNLE